MAVFKFNELQCNFTVTYLQLVTIINCLHCVSSHVMLVDASYEIQLPVASTHRINFQEQAHSPSSHPQLQQTTTMNGPESRHKQIENHLLAMQELNVAGNLIPKLTLTGWRKMCAEGNVSLPPSPVDMVTVNMYAESAKMHN